LFEYDSVAESSQLIIELERLLSDSHEYLRTQPTSLARYKKLLSNIKLVCLFDLETKEIIRLFEETIKIVLESETYDLLEKLRCKLLQITSLEERDSFKKSLLDSFLQNKTRITKNKIKINGEDMEPTVQNWLKDFTINLGINTVDSLKISQYFNSNKNFLNLPGEEKKIIKKLFDIFEKLKQSSLAPGGLEERFVAILPNGKISLINHGIPEDINVEVNKIFQEIAKKNESKKEPELAVTPIKEISETAELEQSIKNYSPSSLEYKALSQEILRLKRTEAKRELNK